MYGLPDIPDIQQSALAYSVLEYNRHSAKHERLIIPSPNSQEADDTGDGVEVVTEGSEYPALENTLVSVACVYTVTEKYPVSPLRPTHEA